MDDRWAPGSGSMGMGRFCDAGEKKLESVLGVCAGELQAADSGPAPRVSVENWSEHNFTHKCINFWFGYQISMKILKTNIMTL